MSGIHRDDLASCNVTCVISRQRVSKVSPEILIKDNWGAASKKSYMINGAILRKILQKEKEKKRNFYTEYTNLFSGDRPLLCEQGAC